MATLNSKGKLSYINIDTLQNVHESKWIKQVSINYLKDNIGGCFENEKRNCFR